ncbi:MAG: DUF2834 domain-containing protein [Curvibacter sp.]
MKKPRLILALLVLGAIMTGAAWMEVLWGIFSAISHSYGPLRIFADLVIALALALVLVLMWRDAKSAGRNTWPWIGVTPLAGSFGPLLYFVMSKEKA